MTRWDTLLSVIITIIQRSNVFRLIWLMLVKQAGQAAPEALTNFSEAIYGLLLKSSLSQVTINPFLL